MRRHKQAVHGDVVFKCPQPGCQFSSSRKTNLMEHLKGFHGTAGSFACDHPGCAFRSTWRHNIAQHKRQVHSDEKPFVCDHTGCSFRAKTKWRLANHKKGVHLNIRDRRCHVCERRFVENYQLRAHMTTHEGDGHELDKCEDCSLYLRRRASRKPRPAAGKVFPCDRQGCDYKSRRKNDLMSHQKYVHSEGKTFRMQPHGMLIPLQDKESSVEAPEASASEDQSKKVSCVRQMCLRET